MGSYLQMRKEAPGRDNDRTDGEAGQRKHHLLATAIFAADTAAREIRRIKQRARIAVERSKRAVTTIFPVIAAKQNDEIVAADMADKVSILVDRIDQNARSQLDVVEGLEVIEIAIGGDKARAGLQQLINLFIDRHIAGQ